MDRIQVALGDRSYEVYVGRDLLAQVGKIGATVVAPGRAALLTDNGVPTIHVEIAAQALTNSGFRVERVSIAAGEESKTLACVSSLCEKLVQLGLDRSSTIIGLGGGVVTDLAGFVAAILFRGIPWIAVPTTLLGQVDAAIGGKTGVDLSAGKNLVGAFWQPRAVVADVDTVKTLSARDLRSGLSEVVKCAVIADAQLANRLEDLCENLLSAEPEALSEVVSRAVAVKVNLVSRDEREMTFARRTLNFGHTVGHALETASGYTLRHGEAIALGMIAAARVSQKLGLCDSAVEERLVRILQKLGLPTDLPALSSASLLAMEHDKKKVGLAVQFVAVSDFGQVQSVELTAQQIAEMLRR